MARQRESRRTAAGGALWRQLLIATLSKHSGGAGQSSGSIEWRMILPGMISGVSTSQPIVLRGSSAGQSPVVFRFSGLDGRSLSLTFFPDGISSSDGDFAEGGLVGPLLSPLGDLSAGAVPSITPTDSANRTAANTERVQESVGRSLRIAQIESKGDPIAVIVAGPGESPPQLPDVMTAPRLLRYQIQPRAPPAAGQRSASRVFGQDVQTDVLERLRFSIAPRGPSLAFACCAETVSDTLRS